MYSQQSYHIDVKNVGPKCSCVLVTNHYTVCQILGCGYPPLSAYLCFATSPSMFDTHWIHSWILRHSIQNPRCSSPRSWNIPKIIYSAKHSKPTEINPSKYDSECGALYSLDHNIVMCRVVITNLSMLI